MAESASAKAGARAEAQDAYGQPLPWNFQRVGRVLNALGTVWIIALMLLINTAVVGRNLFKAPVRGVTELVALSIVGIVKKDQQITRERDAMAEKFLALSMAHAAGEAKATALMERVVRHLEKGSQ